MVLLQTLQHAVLAACTLQDASLLTYLLHQVNAPVDFTCETQVLVKGTKITPLHVAVSNGLHSCVEVLIEANADVNKYVY